MGFSHKISSVIPRMGKRSKLTLSSKDDTICVWCVCVCFVLYSAATKAGEAEGSSGQRSRLRRENEKAETPEPGTEHVSKAASREVTHCSNRTGSLPGIPQSLLHHCEYVTSRLHGRSFQNFRIS